MRLKSFEIRPAGTEGYSKAEVTTGKEYRTLADEYFQTEQYLDFCASRLADLDAIVLEWVGSPDFDQLLLDTVVAGFPAHEHERFVAHFRGLIGMWVDDETRRLSAAG